MSARISLRNKYAGAHNSEKHGSKITLCSKVQKEMWNNFIRGEEMRKSEKVDGWVGVHLRREVSLQCRFLFTLPLRFSLVPRFAKTISLC